LVTITTTRISSSAACMNHFIRRPLLPFIIEANGGSARD
jgi:hypothetical protein